MAGSVDGGGTAGSGGGGGDKALTGFAVNDDLLEFMQEEDETGVFRPGLFNELKIRIQ